MTLAPGAQGLAFRMPIREGVPQVTNALTDQDGNFCSMTFRRAYTLWATDSTHADAEQKGVARAPPGSCCACRPAPRLPGSVRTRQGKPVTDYNIAALPGGQPSAAPNERMRAQMTARMWSPSAQVHDPAVPSSSGA